MARTAALKPEQVPADSKPTLDAFTKNIGFTPNMMATFAQSPIAFNAWAALLGSLSKALDVKTRDSIGLAVSEVNGCNYCLTVHSFTAEHMAKLPADEIILARKGHASDPKRDEAHRAESTGTVGVWRPWRAYAAQHLWTADAAAISESGGRYV
jgi:AhpD family alkylhydroperoxidase